MGSSDFTVEKPDPHFLSQVLKVDLNRERVVAGAALGGGELPGSSTSPGRGLRRCGAAPAGRATRHPSAPGTARVDLRTGEPRSQYSPLRGPLIGSLAAPLVLLYKEHRRQAPDTAKGLRSGPLPWAHAATQLLFPAVVAVAAVPVALSAVGFTGAGIAASSLAAKMMSATAIANGGGVPAGSLVAALQSVGAAGLSTSSNILLASVGSAFGAWFGRSKKEPSSPPEDAEAEEKEPEENESHVEPPKPPVGSEKHEK
ncbi:PREDICTED: uncharacterized protein LOC101372925 [Odobenus rosmarus divergens]|uniref:Uncharacterized protein LOC101372925 n=1 Tax=Odobenus rosmarus divergens TaxID=9708 RepID=A0A2U3VIB9_ODORO|nr:PREDICTED: uncharacterized protein LOC101372925 [Odobenus rosmarus divergens]